MNGTYKYDFSSDSSQFYGGTAGCKQLSPERWGMPAGDADFNGQIGMDDKAVWEGQAGKSNYSTADMNLNGQIDNTDINEFWILNLNMSCQVPE
jgi:hypothetical protein